MKVFVVLAALAVACNAGAIGYAAPVLGVAETGGSQQYRAEDGVGNYNFGYDEAHTSGGSFRRESGNAFGVKSGSYGLHDADGRVRVVNYVADGAGFRAAIQSNEPGVGAQDPAATAINKAHVAVSPAATYAAPIAVAAPAVAAYGGIAAPIVAGAYGAVAAPIVAGAYGGIHAPVLGANYASAVTHGGVVAPAIAAGYGIAAPVAAGYGLNVAHGINAGYGIAAPGVYGGHIAKTHIL